jgi:hypothetical protein
MMSILRRIDPYLPQQALTLKGHARDERKG